MIALFPKPYDDELLYSVLARYFVQCGYSVYISAATDLFEKPATIPDIDLINNQNDAQIRIEYIENHISWFLNNHPDAISEYLDEVRVKYYDKMEQSGQLWFFDKYSVSV